MTNTQFIRLESFQSHGAEHRIVTIEVLKSRGLSQLSLTGLPNAWLRDSRDKIRSLVARYTEWGALDRILVHLLPADESKNGAHLELPIVLACIAALNRDLLTPESLELLKRYRFVGALTLEGTLQATPLSESIEESEGEWIVGPSQFSNLDEVWAFVTRGRSELPRRVFASTKIAKVIEDGVTVEGRYWERFWLQIAAIAEVPVLLVGPPGVGKSHLAQWAHRLLPLPAQKESSVTKRLWTLVDLGEQPEIPLIRPHCRAQLSEFIGINQGGVSRPGYYSLAHGGLLILDEFAEMNHDCREVLRTILDQKKLIRHSRAGTYTWPANFWLIATVNPCPCGWAQGQNLSRCRCDEGQRIKYQAKLSGPILDRLGLKIFMSEQSSDQKLKSCVDCELLDSSPEVLRNFVAAKRPMALKLLDEARILIGENFSTVRERELKTRLLAASMSVLEKSHDESLLMLKLLSSFESTLFSPRQRTLY